MEYTCGRGTTALGIVGTVLGGTALATNGGLLGNILGGNKCACNDGSNMPVSRYDMGLIRENMAVSNENALLKANTFTDGKLADLNDRYNARFTNIEAELAKQAVHNAKVEGSFALAEADLRAAKAELNSRIDMEAERRCCADNAIINYSNATFYPKQVADVTVGTTTTAQMLYNPIPNCNPCCGNK